MRSIFGFKFGKEEKAEILQPSFAPPNNEDGAFTVTAAAQFGSTAIDMDGSAKNEVELITRYREVAMQPEVESAIDDIVNEAIVHDDSGKSVQIVMDNLKQPDKIKKAIAEEFDNVLKLLNFNNYGSDIFRRYYVDGRLFYHIIIDVEHPEEGIKELRYIDPRKIRKVREVKKLKSETNGAELITTSNEYYLYSDKVLAGPTSASSSQGIQISPDSILNVNSGIMDAKRGMVLSYLNKCITGDAKIKTPTGWEYMSNISVGDIIYSFNIETKSLEETEVTYKWNNGIRSIINIITTHSAIKCTPDHLILVKYKDIETEVITYIEAQHLNPDVHSLFLNNNEEDIITISDVADEEVFDIEVKSSWHNFIANELVVHNCIKPLNQLRMIEDATVIYRMSRSAERRVFYIDVGNLPKVKAEQYVKDVMSKYRNKLVYNSTTGQLQSDYRHLSLIEDFWMPRRCLSLNTKIKLLDGRDVELKTLIEEYSQGKINWTYSVAENGTIVPGKISWAGITRKNAELIRITLDNNEYVDCTPDHKFILRDGSLCEAQNLQINSSLMPLYTREIVISESHNITGIQVFDNYTQTWIYPHDMVFDYFGTVEFSNTSIYNHKVIGIEYLSYKEDTGTLTIDEHHEHHNYHNFALSCGIFVKNSDGKGTEITTLKGGENLGQMDDVNYFERKLYKSLNVPVTRLDPSMATSVGRSTEITRDELKFSKFIDKLRHKFSEMFDQALRVQLVLKGICTKEEWDEFKDSIYYDYLKDNNFVELKEAELMQNRLMVLGIIDQYASKYYSKEWINKNVLRLTDLEVKDMEQQMIKDREEDFKLQQQQQQQQLELQQQQIEFQQQMGLDQEQQDQDNPYLQHTQRQ